MAGPFFSLRTMSIIFFLKYVVRFLASWTCLKYDIIFREIINCHYHTTTATNYLKKCEFILNVLQVFSGVYMFIFKWSLHT